ncbi:hypothetical protein Efla_001634 [Eimeria flavescens]
MEERTGFPSHHSRDIFDDAAATNATQGLATIKMISLSTFRGKGARCAASCAVEPANPQCVPADPPPDATTPQADRCAPVSASVTNSEVSPTGKAGKWPRVRRSGSDSASVIPGAAAAEGGPSRYLRRFPSDANGAGAAHAAASPFAADLGAAGEEAADVTDHRGLRRSLRQALLATSGRGQFLGGPAGYGPSAAAPDFAAGSNAQGAPAFGACNTSGVLAGSALGSGNGRRRPRQPQRHALQSYVVGQHHQQFGPQEEEQDGSACLADWLGVDSGTACCCCGSGCVSCSSQFYLKPGATASCSSSSSSSKPMASETAARAGGAIGNVRSTLDVYTTAAKRQKQSHYEFQHQAVLSAPRQEQASAAAAAAAEDILVSPSWFESSADGEEAPAVCIVRPTSPSRAAAFFAEQQHWEELDTQDSAETAAATAGTPWPKGNTSCSFGGYGVATRCGGAVPLCCYCGLPLRPPAAGSLRGAGAESGCPLAAAAAAAGNLGLDGLTQWCRCCTRIYGDLRLQHHRDAAWLPFPSLSLPKAPLRYVLLSADGAKDAPGGAGAVAAALAAAAAADPRRGRTAEDGAAGAAAAAFAEGDLEAAAAPGGAAANSAFFRRTRSGQHFSRVPQSRSSGRGSNTDIMRLRSASCCWPSNTSRGSFLQPIARLQQQLTQLQQQSTDFQPQLQPRVSSVKTNCSELQSEAAANALAGGARGAAPAGEPAAALHAANTAAAAKNSVAAAAAAPTLTLMQAGGAAGSDDLSRSSGDKPVILLSGAAPPWESVKASSSAAAERTQGLGGSSSSAASHDSFQQGRVLSSSEKPQVAGKTAVVPRVYLESSSGCYVATAFDASRLQLLQKRFCCLILGEQRAHALACQWLRWVQRSSLSRKRDPGGNGLPLADESGNDTYGSAASRS